ncbi:MAG: hypothetical protein Q8O67_10610 [Deltaproteobacteria bacterium]|nr:hypothetical protein [Deltaproteobacteria bacterium]
MHVPALIAVMTLAAVDVVVPVSVVGEAALDGDVEQATRGAKREARRQALESSAGPLLKSNMVLRNNYALIGEILGGSKGLLIDEEWSEPTPGATGTTIRIGLRARVNQSELERAICTVVRANYDPRVSLVVVETPGDVDAGSSGLRPLLASAFVDVCIRVDDSAVSDSQAQHLVRATSTVAPDKSNRWTATLQATLINTATEEVEGEASKAATLDARTAADAQAALPDVFKVQLVPEVMSVLLPKIIRRWNNDTPASRSVQVVVEGKGPAAAAVQALVLKVLPRARILTRDSGFDVDVDGGAETLAVTIEGKRIGKQVVEIIEVTRGRVVLKLKGIP